MITIDPLRAANHTGIRGSRPSSMPPSLRSGKSHERQARYRVPETRSENRIRLQKAPKSGLHTSRRVRVSCKSRTQGAGESPSWTGSPAPDSALRGPSDRSRSGSMRTRGARPRGRAQRLPPVSARLRVRKGNPEDSQCDFRPRSFPAEPRPRGRNGAHPLRRSEPQGRDGSRGGCGTLPERAPSSASRRCEPFRCKRVWGND